MKGLLQPLLVLYAQGWIFKQGWLYIELSILGGLKTAFFYCDTLAGKSASLIALTKMRVQFKPEYTIIGHNNNIVVPIEGDKNVLECAVLTVAV